MKKSNKNNIKSERLQLQRRIGEIIINYFTRKKGKRWTNWIFQNNGISNHSWYFKIFPLELAIYCQVIKTKPFGFFANRAICFFKNKMPNQIKNSYSVKYLTIKLEDLRNNG